MNKLDISRIHNTLGKMAHYLSNHNSICVSVSGGSDSDIIVHMIATYFREYLYKVHFVFVNTGLEYKSTLRHLEYMEKRYDIHIDRIRGRSVVLVVKEDGVPIISKNYSKMIGAAINGKAWALRQIARTREESPKYALSKNQKNLANYLLANPVKVSSSCCDKSKKYPLHQYQKSIGADLDITGERKAEGGVRSTAHTTCFEARDRKADKYMPLWFWDDETKQYYKDAEGIIYSDCYEVWGMKRTGCVGCPFNSRVGADLKMIEKHEPLLYKACLNVFGESYRLMDQFNVRRMKILQKDEDAP